MPTQATPPVPPPPVWLRWLPFFSNSPALTRRQWQILGLVSLAAFFGAYTGSMLALALPQIQASLDIPADQLSNVIALIRFGALPAFGLTLAADRWGRRRLFLFSVMIFALLSGATAFAPSLENFIALQFLARTFVAASGLLAGVILVEEFPEGARGWGIGAYTALASVGGGAAAVLFALVDVVPFGWRALFLVALPAMLISPRLHHYLPETTRFIEQTQARSTLAMGRRTQPLVQLVRAYPGRFVALAAVVIFFNLGGDAALFYDPTYLQQAHGWQPWQISLLNLGAGFMALLGSAYAGQLSDRIGRKRASMLFLSGMALFVVGYYNAFGLLLPVLWAGFLFTSIGAGVSLGTLSTELFPTSYRSTAAGATSVVATTFGALSLVAHNALLGLAGSPWLAISWLAALLLVAPLLVLLLPETSSRTLEEIAPER